MINESVGGKFSYSLFDKNYAARKNTPYYYNQDFITNIQFIFDHFQEPLFPRTISTQRTKKCQIMVNDINHVYEEFKKSIISNLFCSLS